MANTRKVLGTFNAMNRMGKIMMKSMMNMTQGKPDWSPFCGMPGMPHTMANMGQMNQKAVDMMQGARSKAGKQAETMIPQMQAQMNQMVACMNLMNQTALNMMQMAYAQNLQMMAQFFESVGKQAAAAQNQTGEPAAEEGASQPASDAPETAEQGENE